MHFRATAALVAVALLAAACGTSTVTPAPTAGSTPAPTQPPGSTAAPSADPTAIDYEQLLFSYVYEPAQGSLGGSVVIGDWQPVANLNGYYDTSLAAAQVLAATMRGLWTVTSDGHYKPDLAAKIPTFSGGSIRQAPDGSFDVDVELRPGLAWSDGTPLTLNDLRYTWQWNLDPAQVGLPLGTTGWEDISAIDVSSDGLKATIKFARPYAGFYGVLSSVILPEHYFSTIPIADASNRSMPVSPAIKDVPASGPFAFENASPDGISLTRNPHWVGGALDTVAYLDTVTFQYFASKAGMITAFLEGAIDVALNMGASDYAAIQGVDPSIGEAIIEPAWQYEHLDLNQGPNGHPMLSDVTLRRAIFGAIDQADLYAKLYPGYPVPEVGACSPAPPGTYWRTDTVSCPQFDAAAAKTALAAAGWTDSNGDGTVDKSGREAVLEACTTEGDLIRKNALDVIAGYLKDVGIKVNITLADGPAVMFAAWLDTTPETKCSLLRGNYDLALFAWRLSFDLFGNYYFTYHTDQWPDEDPHDGSNHVRFSNPEMDAALDTLQRSINTEDQIKAVLTVQRIFADQVAEIPLYYREAPRGISTRLGNFFPNPSTATDMWNIEDWFIR